METLAKDGELHRDLDSLVSTKSTEMWAVETFRCKNAVFLSENSQGWVLAGENFQVLYSPIQLDKTSC